MSKRISAKYKIDRRLGVNLWGRPKSPINKRSYGPGQHGQGRKKKDSDFGLGAHRALDHPEVDPQAAGPPRNTVTRIHYKFVLSHFGEIKACGE